MRHETLGYLTEEQVRELWDNGRSNEIFISLMELIEEFSLPIESIMKLFQQGKLIPSHRLSGAVSTQFILEHTYLNADEAIKLVFLVKKAMQNDKGK